MDYNLLSINGFHGTHEKAAVAICESNTYTYNHRDDHWLGQGVYFFKDDPDQAMSWAYSQVENGEKACVIKSMIKVEDEAILDLDTRTGIFKLDSLIKRHRSLFEEFDLSLGVPKENGDSEKRLRCMIYDLLPSDIKVIQKYFDIKNQPKVIKNPLMGTLGINMFSVQVCVRDQSVIDIDSIQVYKETTKNSFVFKPRKNRRNKVNFKKG